MEYEVQSGVHCPKFPTRGSPRTSLAFRFAGITVSNDTRCVAFLVPVGCLDSPFRIPVPTLAGSKKARTLAKFRMPHQPISAVAICIISTRHEVISMTISSIQVSFLMFCYVANIDSTMLDFNAAIFCLSLLLLLCAYSHLLLLSIITMKALFLRDCILHN